MSNFEIIIPFLEPLRELFENRDVTEILVNDGGRRSSSSTTVACSSPRASP